MSRTRIKICGITRPEDAALAGRLGADAIGMIFHQASRRGISLDVAREIIAVLGPFTTPVGLFVDASTSEILDTAGQLGIRHVQLHGHESAQQVAELRGLCVLKAIRVDPGHFGQTLRHWREQIESLRLGNLKALVLETAASVPGGSGIPNDWRTIAEHQQTGGNGQMPPLIAAGGLSPQNVADVIRMLHPFAVDVSSGVEDRPGEKSKEKMVAFFEAVRSAQTDT